MRSGMKKPVRGIRDNRILTPSQVIFLRRFIPSELNDVFRLTGGTALSAFYLEHRISEDLDFFSSEKVAFHSLERVLKGMDCVSEISYTKQFDRNLFRIKLEDASLLKVEFTYYSLRNLEDPHIVEGMRVDSFLDIVVNKLCAIADRTEAKDFVDVYTSLRKGNLSLNRLVVLAEKKCAISGIRHILKRRLLQIPDGINRLPLKAEIKAQEMEALFEKLIRKMVEKEVGERK
jgi:predicted nucleotidyltransferase component of viral defense system